jgi:hypothetical protein
MSESHQTKVVLPDMVTAAQTRIDVHGSLQFHQETIVEELTRLQFTNRS